MGSLQYFSEVPSPRKKQKMEETPTIIDLLDHDAEDDSDELMNILGEEADDTGGFRHVHDEGGGDGDGDENPFVDREEGEEERDSRASQRSESESPMDRRPDLFGTREKEMDYRSIHDTKDKDKDKGADKGKRKSTPIKEGEDKEFGAPRPKRMKSAPPTSSQSKIAKEEDEENKPYLQPIEIKPKAKQLRLSKTAFKKLALPPITGKKSKAGETIGGSRSQPTTPTKSSKCSIQPLAPKSKPTPKPSKRSPSDESRMTEPPKKERHPCPLCSKMIAGDNAALNSHIDWCLSRAAIMEASAG